MCLNLCLTLFYYFLNSLQWAIGGITNAHKRSYAIETGLYFRYLPACFLYPLKCSISFVLVVVVVVVRTVNYQATLSISALSILPFSFVCFLFVFL